jgi:acetyl esterase/lipase
MSRTSEEIQLWPGVAPGSEGWTQQESKFTVPDAFAVDGVRNVVVPTLTPVLPDPGSATGTGVLVCPGGGYFMLAMFHEGFDVAAWLAARGVAAFVLKYRVRETPASDVDWFTAMGAQAKSMTIDDLLAEMDRFWETPIADAVRAMGLIRERADEWGVNLDRLGAVGFSAGGQLVLDLASGPDEARPRFIGAIYPAYAGRAVPPDAPPLFLAVAEDDILVSHTLAARQAWKGVDRPVEAHLFAKGAHGFGMRKQGLPSDGWIDRLHDWLGSEGFLT